MSHQSSKDIHQEQREHCAIQRHAEHVWLAIDSSEFPLYERRIWRGELTFLTCRGRCTWEKVQSHGKLQISRWLNILGILSDAANRNSDVICGGMASWNFFVPGLCSPVFQTYWPIMIFQTVNGYNLRAHYIFRVFWCGFFWPIQQNTGRPKAMCHEWMGWISGRPSMLFGRLSWWKNHPFRSSICWGMF